MNARVFSITGRMGAGKSHAATQLAARFAADGLNFTHINIDDIRRSIVTTHPAYAGLRRIIAGQFGVEAKAPHHALCRAALAAAVFATPEGPATFWQLAGSAIVEEARAIIAQAQGHVALEWVRLAEDGFLPLITDNIVVITCSDNALTKRFENADLPPTQIAARRSRQTALPQLPPGWPAPLVFDTSENPAPAAYDALYRRIRHAARRQAA